MKTDITAHPATITYPKAEALASFLGVEVDNICEERHEHYGLEVFSYGGEEYAVGDDDEADDAQDKNLEDYIDECILPEIPEPYRNYFDNEAWKRDARHDGRGHALSSYDGNENESKWNGEWFYIYRIN
jgi:hypothetical protein